MCRVLLNLTSAAACLCLLVACAAHPTAAPMPEPVLVLSTKELMERIIDPTADVFWGASGTIITAKGARTRAPTTDAGWQATVNAAATLAESANLLMLPGRAVDQKEWTRFARQLADASVAGMNAAQARDERGVFATGGAIYVVCMNCHKKYVAAFQ